MELLQVAFVWLCCLAIVVIVINQIVVSRELRAAHREYRRLLLENEDSLRTLREQIMLDGVVTFDELEHLIRTLERIAEGLSERHRRVIAPSLREHFVRDRARYAAGLMNRAGIGSGYFPIPTV
jgi:hypothetical protein